MSEVVFLGDDFTGASDSLATYARNGWPSRLVLGVDAGTTGLAALGLPTDLRSLGPRAAAAEIAALWPRIAAATPRIVHFKVCSTFDSSPAVGSIGAVTADLIQRFRPDVIAVIGGQPSLGRYCIFGNLFAAGPDGMVHRIDRHPVMGQHPVTPMAEADLRQHLRHQGMPDLDLIPYTALGDTAELVRRLRGGPVLLDVTTAHDQSMIAAALRIVGGRQLLIGASSVAEIVAKTCCLADQPAPIAPPVSRNLLVFAGSRSANTQVQVARAQSYTKIPLTPQALHSEHLIAEVVAQLRAEVPVLVHLQPNVAYDLSPDALATESSAFVAAVLAQVDVGYLGLAGGDTSSRIANRLGFDALDFARSVGAGACICVGRHRDAGRDRMRIMLKGGQMGTPDLFDDFAQR